MVAVLLAALAFETSVRAVPAENDRLQASLTNRCVLTDYAAQVRVCAGTNIWTDALQAALGEHEIVVIPPSEVPYYVDRTVVIPSNRRIEAAGATVRATRALRTVIFRNEHVADGTLKPIPSGARDRNIALVGGRYEDWCTRRGEYGGALSRIDGTRRAIGNYNGVIALFFFNNCDHLTLRDLTFARAGDFAVQTGDGRDHAYENITFDRCHADGLHLNGNLSRIFVRNVRGQVGDDLVALNAYDWLGSSVDFGPQRDIVCEDLELVRKPGCGAYPAIRIQPAKFRYADGTVVDCAVSNIVFRKVRGIETFKMYLQTPPYVVGTDPEWSAIGSGGNLTFEDIAIDLTGPLDRFLQYASSDPVRGHYAAFELGANLSGVHFRNIDVRFHLDRYPQGHLVTVGPKSASYVDREGRIHEIFDPYVDCRVTDLTLEDIRTQGVAPTNLVQAIVFDDLHKDGHSSGRGSVVGLRDLCSLKGE